MQKAAAAIQPLQTATNRLWQQRVCKYSPPFYPSISPSHSSAIAVCVCIGVYFAA